MHSDLLEALAARAQSDTARTDMWPGPLAPPLTRAQLQQSQARVDFTLPHLYVEILTQIGNGGFGPGYGLMGLHGGATDDLAQTALDLYSVFARPDPQEPSWDWPHGLLPICTWGCAIYSCLDCTRPDAPVITWDPNDWEDGTPTALGFANTGYSLASWLRAWVEGAALWDDMTGNTSASTVPPLP